MAMNQTDIITSPHNSRLKELRRLRRRRERERAGRFIAEGEDLVAAAHRAGRTAVEGYRAAGANSGEGETDASHTDLIPATQNFVEVEPAVLAEVSSLGSGTRTIGVYEQRFLDAPAGPLCVYLHGVSDPGNVGTILRSAEAFGASCVALGPGCADPHSPKAVRASMGAIFGVPLARAATIRELPGERVALVAHTGLALSDLKVEQPLTLLIGAEREGLPEDVVSGCTHTAHIPIRSESLNAAMAATIGLYEMSDWGRIGGRPPRLAGLRPAAPPSRVHF
jgi:TrmH family RNA methyltransferase